MIIFQVLFSFIFLYLIIASYFIIKEDFISNFSIVHALPEGDYLIKFWGKMLDCNDEINKNMFSKYVEYL
jgi:hypothetical protein